MKNKIAQIRSFLSCGIRGLSPFGSWGLSPLVALICWGLSPWGMEAAEVEYAYKLNNVLETAKISYEGAELSWVDAGDGVNRDLILTFTNVNEKAQFSLPSPKLFRARILAVAGGGAGGTQARQATGAGGGGAGGYMENENCLLQEGTYFVSVGAGGLAADEKITATPGGNGGNSMITNAAGSVIASAVGGGGGGASVPNAMVGGQSGGSGGGGAWVNGKSTSGGYGAGGNGRDGQGHNGGTPSVLNNGGGGGGAGAAGGADGSAGAGKTSDISGTAVEYARGGVGGRKDTIAAAATGAGFGWGGNGGNGGFGGAGADGVVIVRFTKMYENVQIPYPFVAENEKTAKTGRGGLYSDGDGSVCEFAYSDAAPRRQFLAFNSNATFRASNGVTYKYADAIRYIDGIMTTNCTASTKADGTPVLLGSGHHQFVIYLQDGFSWQDGSPYGSTSGHLVDWRITDDLQKVDATIRVEKSVKWSDDGSNAVINITSHSTPAQNPVTPKVLFLGTRCQAHDLTVDTIQKSINACLQMGDVDWYIYDKTETAPISGGSGSNKKGDAVKLNFKISGSCHATLNQFYAHLYDVMTKTPDKYDYIVFEFDGSRVACSYTVSATSGNWKNWKIEQEAAVAKWLVPFYEQNRVVWIVDNCFCGSSSTSKGNEPFGGEQYWRPNNAEFGNATHNYPAFLTDVAYRGLVGMFDPALYCEKKPTANTKAASLSVDSRKWTTSYYESENGSQKKASTSNPVYFYAANPMTNQVHYDNPEACVQFLLSSIKPVAYNLTFQDKVMADVGLSLTYMNFFVATNDLPVDAKEGLNGWRKMADWKPAMGATVNFEPSKSVNIPNLGGMRIDLSHVHTSTNHVEVSMTNMLIETWAKVEIGVVDDGTFKTSVDATYNPVTGEWEKNPNDGKARVAMVDEAGNETEVKGEAATSAAWKFFTYKVKGRVEGGELFMNGMTKCIAVESAALHSQTGTIAFCEGYSPIISYRGLPGYILRELFVDANPMTFDDATRSFWMFNKLAGDHSVEAIYEDYVKSVTATPSTNTYDGAGHVFPVAWEVAEDVTYPIEARYALTKDGPYTNETAFLKLHGVEVKDVGDHPLYYKVFAYQPGYGESIADNGWVAVGETLIGSGVCTNTVLPKNLYVTAVSTNIDTRCEKSRIPYAGVRYEGFIDGEDADVLDARGLKLSCPTYAASDKGAGRYAIQAEGLKDPKGNYNIVYLPGELTVEKSLFQIDGIDQTAGLDPENAEIYTGVRSIDKVYDGAATGLTVKVTWPKDFRIGGPYNGAILFSTDDGATWQAENPQFTDVCAKTKVLYRLEDSRCFTMTNYAYVTVRPRPVTLVSASAEKVYDGVALESDKVTVLTNDSSLAFVAGEGCDTWCKTRVTDVGSLPNNFDIVRYWDGTKAENYTVTQVPGTLTVTMAQIRIGDPDHPVTYPIDTDERMRPEPGSNGVLNVVKEYDGQGTNIVVNVVTPSTGRTVLFTTNAEDSASWTPDFALTNVCDGVGVWFSVNDDRGNFAPVTNLAYVTILPRKATVTAADATKVYDGRPLVSDGFTTDNFVDGEGIAAVKMTAESAITDVGTADNAVDADEVVPQDGTLLSNYELTFEKGTLEVTKRPLTLTSPTKSAKYAGGSSKVTFDGSEIVAEGYVSGEEFRYGDFAAQSGKVGVKEATFKAYDNGAARLDNYDITYVYGKLTLGSANVQVGGVEQPGPGQDPLDPEKGESGVTPTEVVYDGEGHSIRVDVTYPTDRAVKIRYTTTPADADSWSETNPAFTNVCTKMKVWYAVDAGSDFKPATNYSWVTVKPRPVAVRANDQTMTYGEEAPSLDGQFVVSNGVADVCAVSLRYTNETFAAGVATDAIVRASDVKFTHPALGDVTDNYLIDFVPGTLTVLKGTYEVTVTDVTKTYDGKGTNIVVEVSDPEAEIWYRDPTTGEWTQELSVADVRLADGRPAPYAIEYKVVDPAGNHADKTGTAKLLINPREVIVAVNPLAVHIDVVRAGKDRELFSAIVTYRDNGETLKAEDLAKLNFTVDATGDKKIGENVLSATGETYQGNFVVTYVPNVLTIYEKLAIPYTVKGVVEGYSGAGWKVRVTLGEDAPAGTVVGYAYGEKSDVWYGIDDPLCPAVTNVTRDGGLPIWFRISVPGQEETYQTVVASAVAVVTQKVVTVTADDKKKTFGEADPALTATVTGLVPSETARAAELIAYAVAREPGETVGTYAINASGSDDQGNYRVEFVPGTFTIANLAIKYEAPDISVPYDGTGKSPEIRIDPEVKDPVVKFLDGDGREIDKPSFTDVVSTNVTFVIEAPGRTPVTNTLALTVYPRQVEIVSANRRKVYDGTPLYADVFAIGGLGMAPGENFDFDCTNIVNVGSCPALFEVLDSDTASLSNYEVTCGYGTLTVEPSAGQIEVRSLDGFWNYDGEPHAAGCVTNNASLLAAGDRLDVVLAGTTITEPGEVANAFTSVRVLRGEEDVTANYANLTVTTGRLEIANAWFENSDIVAKSYEGTYDGQPTNIVVNILKTKGVRNAKVSYSTDGISWSEENPSYADVTNAAVWYAVSADFHDGWTSAVPATVSIRPRAVTLTSSDGRLQYGQGVLKTDLEQIAVGGDGLVAGEAFKFATPASLGKVGTIPASFTYEPANAKTKLSNYAVTPSYGTLTMFAADALTVFANSATWEYDGEVHADNGFTVTNLVAGDTVVATFSPASAITYPDQSPVSNVVTAVKVLRGEEDVTDQYSSVDRVPGALKVTPRSFGDVTAVSTNVVYDGLSHSIRVIRPAFVGAGELSVTYSETGDAATYTTNNPAYRDVCDRTVWYKVEKRGYEPFVGTATVTVTRRNVTLASEGGEKNYDGQMLSNDVVKVVTGDGSLGLAEGDVLTARTTVGQLHVGQVDNAFEYEIFDPEHPGEDIQKNYFVTPVFGSLKVNPRPVDLAFAAADKTYDGTTVASCSSAWFVGTVPGEVLKFNREGMTFAFDTPLVGSGKTVTAAGYADDRVTGVSTTRRSDYAVTFVPTAKAAILKARPPELDPDPGDDPKFPPEAGPFFEDPATPPPAAKDPDGKPVELSNYDVTVVYDGEGHTFNRDDLCQAIATNKWISDGFGVTYSADGVTWVDDPYVFTNAVATSFWYRVTTPSADPNYSNYVHAVGVTVLPREVTFASASDSWTYDGAAHSNVTVRVTAGSFVDGEGIVTNGFATIRDKGEKPNAYGFAWQDNTDPANYAYTVVTGTLAVTAKDVSDGDDVQVAAVTDRFYYNRDGKEPKPAVTDRGTALVEGTDFDFSWVDNTNATTGAKLIATFKGNYAGAITNDFTILPRTVTLVSANGEWTYDGVAHSNLAVSATAYTGADDPDAGFGFVPGEGVATNGFATVTTVTDGVPNAFLHSLLPGTLAANYAITAKKGTLKVKPAGLPPPDDPELPPATGPFTGPNVPPETPLPSPVDPEGNPVELSDFDVTVTYDGQAHTFDTNALFAKLAATELHGNAPLVEYSLTGAADSWVAEPYAYTDAVATSFWYRVSADNYVSTIHAVGVTVLPREVVFEFPKVSKTYDGTTDFLPETTLQTNLLQATGHNMVGEEKFTVYGWGRFLRSAVGASDGYLNLTNILTVASNGAKDMNYVKYYRAGGVLMLLDTDEDGRPTVNGEPLDEDHPVGSPAEITSADKPSDGQKGKYPEPEKYPTDGNPVPPPAPTAALSDYDTTSVYNGVGHTMDTNALWNLIWNSGTFVIADGDRKNVRVTFSADGSEWLEDPLLFVNVTTTSFWYRVEVPNYETKIHAVAVKVQTRPVTIKATDQSMTYGDVSTLTPGFGKPAAWAEVATKAKDTGLADGDVINNVNLTFKEDPSSYTAEKKVWEGVIVTPAQAKAVPYRIMRGDENVTANYKIEFQAGNLTVTENTAHFAATLKWRYYSGTGSYFAQLSVTNVNATGSFQFTSGSMRFCFADRVEDDIIKLALGDKVHRKNLLDSFETFKGVKYRSYRLADPVPGEANGGWTAGAKKDYGPAEGAKLTDKNVVGTPEMYVYRRVNPTYGNEGFTMDEKDGNMFLGWLVWESGATTHAIPLLAGKTAEELADLIPPTSVTAPVSLKRMNFAAATGLPVAEDADPSCRLTAFEVSADEVAGRIEVSSGSKVGNLGEKVSVTLMGTAELGTKFADVLTVEVDKDGTFRVARPKKVNFFKVRLETRAETFK